MNDYKELLGDINDCLIAHPSQTLYKRLLRDAADAIEQLVKEGGAEASGMCKFRITGFESSKSWERYQYSSDAPVDVTVFAKSKKEAIEKAEKIIGCPISTTNRYIVVQEVEHE